MAKTNQGKGNYKNKLSRTYRFKKKTGKVKKPTGNADAVKDQANKPRIVIRNLSFQTTESDIHRLYEPFGQIDEIKLLKRPDGKLVGCGFVQFRNMEDASKAIFKTNKSNFLGRTISSEWAIPKSQFVEKIKKEEESEEIKEENSEEDTAEQTTEIQESDTNKKTKNKKDSFSKKNTPSKAEQRKLFKLKKRQKRSRIIIRNLPFTITEEAVKERFSKYGNIEEIRMMKKPNGAPTGCCFLQFDRVQAAAQSIHHENLKQFLDRSIVVDWAIAKDKYQKSGEETQVKSENDEDDGIVILKEEKNENFNEGEVKIKEEKESDDEIKNEDESDKEQSDEVTDDDVNSEDDHDEENEEEDDEKNVKLELDNESVSSQHPRRISNDVSEGKTVFIKNVPFSAKNEDLKECMEQFGPVYYALVCMDRLTEHSRGTAFVKFRNVEDAEKCLAAGTELKLHDQILDPHRALHRNEVNQKNEDKKKKIKDSRNLYLVKEGVILAGLPAAEGVSAPDMARRLQLEQWKSQMLRNLNMFVSKTRLVIHNLPPTADDAKLRQLFKNHSRPDAVITEARVMRDLKNVDGQGVGMSKEHGFVSFADHEDALKALRSINNNPNIFTRAKRPIVAFSIENRIMVNAKHRRIEKSRQNNPLWKGKRQADDQGPTNDGASGDKKQNPRKKKRTAAPKSSEAAGNEEVESFVGSTGKPGVNRMHGKFFIKNQAAQHSENLKEQKRKSKNLKRLTAKNKEMASSRNEAKPKQGSKRQDADEANFSRLVNSYKNKLSSVTNYKSKWYENST